MSVLVMAGSCFPKPYADYVARLRVPGGFVLIAAFLWLADPAPWSLAWGLPIAFLGLCLRAWAAGHITKDQRLTVSGPYAHIRNPLYVGTLLGAAGLVLASCQPIMAILFAAVFLFVYLPVIELEEQHLRELFPEFGDYAARVPMLLPRLTHYRNTQRFSWSLYLRNREYQAFLAFLAGVSYLVWRAGRH